MITFSEPAAPAKSPALTIDPNDPVEIIARAMVELDSSGHTADAAAIRRKTMLPLATIMAHEDAAIVRAGQLSTHYLRRDAL